MQIAISKTGTPINIPLALANRHGLIAGATGTGKTVTLQKLAESFSKEGVPVFLADVKGDLSGLAAAGTVSEKLASRLQANRIETPIFASCPAMFWDVFGQNGHPVRTTLSEMGPQLLGRLLNLNETQTSVLQMLFQIADDSALLLLDVKDLNSLIQFVQENDDKFKAQYGNMSGATLGTIQRNLLTLQSQGAKDFFGEPGLNLADFMQKDSQGNGFINILSSEKLLQSPALYSTFLLWMLSELFETLPEVGDLPKPKLVFFFDEAHLLFKEAPKVLVEKIEQVVRLIRSKGVGVYFVTQSPSDIPSAILGQLSHRVQHALRAFTPADKKAVDIAAETLRPNPKFSAREKITTLGVGEALISFLEANGTPGIVEEAIVLPPGSRIGPLLPEERKICVSKSPVAGFYEAAIDRVSAFETLASAQQNSSEENVENGSEKIISKSTSKTQGEPQGLLSEILLGKTGPRGGRKAGLLEKAATSAAKGVASSLGREILRGIMGSLLGGKRR